MAGNGLGTSDQGVELRVNTEHRTDYTPTRVVGSIKEAEA
jgi:hypothetical protein